MKNKVIGLTGESKACDYLQQNNYDILERNYTCPLGEIDVIAYDKRENRIVFVEVKARSTLSFGAGRYAITHVKKSHITNSATYYLKSKKKFGSAIRFDLIELKNDEITHLKAVF